MTAGGLIRVIYAHVKTKELQVKLIFTFGLLGS